MNDRYHIYSENIDPDTGNLTTHTVADISIEQSTLANEIFSKLNEDTLDDPNVEIKMMVMASHPDADEKLAKAFELGVEVSNMTRKYPNDATLGNKVRSTYMRIFNS